MPVWTIGVAAWIIQDGNYDDFVLRQRCEFAVEALPRSIEPRPVEEAPKARLREDSSYEFVGLLKFLKGGAWVVDLGLRCYGNRPLPQGARVGEVLAGETYLGIQGPGIYDTGFFVEAPALTYSWRIERIRLETTPLVEVAPRSFQRDEARVSYVDVKATNAWNDDNGNGAYLLDCALLSPTPRRFG